MRKIIAIAVAARALDVSTSRVWQLIDEGKLETVNPQQIEFARPRSFVIRESLEQELVRREEA